MEPGVRTVCETVNSFARKF